MAHRSYPQQSSLAVGLRGRCPRCGEGKLFGSFLKVAEKCRSCDLDYSDFDSGDGPAIFIMLIAGFIIVGGVLYVEVSYTPPYWVHAVLWLPATILLPLILLPILKGWMVAQQYKHNAREGRQED